MRIIVTGAAGFIGANIIKGLNARGHDDILAVDDLTNGMKFTNLRDLEIADYVDKDVFYNRFAAGDFGTVAAVFHEGACSNTMEMDGRYMMATNYRCTVDLLDACQQQNTALLYASSAAVYGASETFAADPANERPLNVYGYSKLLVDNVVRRRMHSFSAQVAGFRYFNVYGPREEHKGQMASVAYHQYRQMAETGRVKLFGGYDGYERGEQSRDFVHVDDVVAVNLWFLENPAKSGIFNLGTGRAQPFNDVAQAVVNGSRKRQQLAKLTFAEILQQELIDYIEFPDALKGKYQSFTQADIGALRRAGYERDFTDVDAGVSSYVDWLTDQR